MLFAKKNNTVYNGRYVQRRDYKAMICSQILCICEDLIKVACQITLNLRSWVGNIMCKVQNLKKLIIIFSGIKYLHRVTFYVLAIFFFFIKYEFTPI